MNVVVASDPVSLADEATARFEMIADQAIAMRGRFAVALTGGATASPLYGRLASAQVEWSRVVLLQAHDRSIPLYDAAGHAVSHRMLMGWLELPAADDDVGIALGDSRRVDLVHLGLLPDGRFDTSLGDPYLDSARQIWVIALGARCADPLRRIVEDDTCDWPAALLLRRSKGVVCFADRDAAARLSASANPLGQPLRHSP